jgi:hypothetical protein
MSVAMVETGGDPGHERARYTYEKVGFELFPVARYFKKLACANVDFAIAWYPSTECDRPIL